MEFKQEEDVVKKYHLFRAPWLGTSNQFIFREIPARVYRHTKPEVGFIMDPEMKDEAKKNLLNHDDWAAIAHLQAEQVDSARYMVGHRDEGYFLWDRKVAFFPIFGYHKDLRQLIHLVLLVSNWQLELERNNLNSGIQKSDVHLEFEILEGVEKSLIENQKGVIAGSAESLVLEYKNNFPPAMRCKVSAKRNDLFLSALYLDSSYGVTHLSDLKIPDTGKPEYLSYRLNRKKITWYSISLSPSLISQGLNEATEYICFIISTRKLNTEKLVQQGFEPSITSSAEFQPQAERIISVGDADWMAFSVPVKIIYRKLSFEEKAEQINKEIPVQFPDDPQKGRWGGQPNRSGLLLKAEVQTGGSKSQSSIHVFPLVISVTSLTKGSPPAGKIAFFLHHSFARPVIITQFENGTASIRIQAAKAFTIGAYSEDGTMLELDMNNEDGYPQDFYDT